MWNGRRLCLGRKQGDRANEGSKEEKRRKTEIAMPTSPVQFEYSSSRVKCKTEKNVIGFVSFAVYRV